MLKKLRLERFKSFQEAELILGPLTVLVGTNASGKSNIRDAFRFLHGISRGYTLAEILGEKYGEGGYLQWRGIRGGTREVTFSGTETFALGVDFNLEEDGVARGARYRALVEAGVGNRPPVLVVEYLTVEGPDHVVFLVDETYFKSLNVLTVAVKSGLLVEGSTSSTSLERQWQQVRYLSSLQPVLSQLADPDTSDQWVRMPLDGTGATEAVSGDVTDHQPRHASRGAMDAFSSMRFLDLSPEAMRRPSLPGQTVLGDQGENLSSVLQAICQDEQGKATLLSWLQELTPMDAADFEFPAGPDGKILLTLVEKDGRKVSAYSASDGTLRFLGMLAALLRPEPARLYFLEELENGIHPSRLHLLLQLIEQTVANRGIQVVATTHSPLVLTLLSRESLECASVTYRLEGKPDTQVKRLLDIPHAREVLEKEDPGRLHEARWFEDALFFTAENAEERDAENAA